MRRGRTALAATAGALLVVGCAVRGVQGCYSAIPNDGLVDAGPPVMSDVKLPEAGGESGFVGTGPACDGSPGAVPAPNCFDPSALLCSPSQTCSLGNPSTCGATTCLPMTTNTAPTYNFRMEQLNIAAPPVLASTLIQGAVVNAGVTLNAPSCGYGPWDASDTTFATGAFTWLLSVNKKSNMLTTGGGGPVDDPYKTGYCFVKGNYSGTPVAPIDVPITFTGDTFSTTTPYDKVLNIPIFPTITAITSPIILPIRGARLDNVGISPDGNCIGDINPQWPATGGTSCNNSPVPSCPKWFTNGSLAGYLTLRDADNVGVLLTMQSLCVLLLGKQDPTTQTCSRNGSDKYSCCTDADYSLGDYSSPGGTPNDSVWLSATFAANAVLINDSTAPPCGP